MSKLVETYMMLTGAQVISSDRLATGTKKVYNEAGVEREVALSKVEKAYHMGSEDGLGLALELLRGIMSNEEAATVAAWDAARKSMEG